MQQGGAYLDSNSICELILYIPMGIRPTGLQSRRFKVLVEKALQAPKQLTSGGVSWSLITTHWQTPDFDIHMDGATL